MSSSQTLKRLVKNDLQPLFFVESMLPMLMDFRLLSRIAFLKRPAKVWCSILMLTTVSAVGIWGEGPLFIGDEPTASIYHDFDDGLYGRSLYRGVVFSIKLTSFQRYRTLPVGETDGLTAYLISPERAAELATGRVLGTNRIAPLPGERDGLDDNDPAYWLYIYERKGIRVVFSLERPPNEIFDEIQRTYPENPVAAGQVSDSYRSGWVIRIHEAENVFQPFIARIDYEDVMIAASLLASRFQPLWGIHDGNDVLAGGF